jgi:hypothetical protein
MGKRKVFSLLRFGAPLLAGRLSPAREKEKEKIKWKLILIIFH